MTEYECQSCGHVIDMDKDCAAVLLVDCSNCEDELATYEKNTIEPEEQSDGHSKPNNDAPGRSEPNSGSTKPFSIA